MKIRKKIPSVLKYGALLLTIILLLFPIYWMVICSLMPTHYLTVLPPHFVPVDITLDNYIQIAQTPKYVAYFRNSVIVAVGTVLTTLVLSVPAGYAFSRYRFRGKSALLSAVMSVQMFPIVVILASDTTFALPLAVTLVKSFFDTVPKSLDESARIDGAGKMRTLVEILFPLVKPGIVAVCIYTFLNAWDDYMMSLIIMQDASMKTLPVGIAETFLGEYCYNYGGMMAFAVIGSLPIVLLFIFLQKHMIAGLTAGAVKG